MRQRCFDQRHQRRLVFLTLTLALAMGAFLIGTGATAPTAAIAQDDEALLDDAPAGDAADEAPAADASSGDADEAPRGEESYFTWGLKALGLFFGPVFLIVSFIMVALLVMNILAMRRENLIPTGLVETFEEHLNQSQFQEAYELAKADGTFLGVVLAAGLARVSSGYEEAVKGMEEAGEEEAMKLEHRLSYLSLIGNISPMLGLFGTVYGMMNAFSLIATSGATPKPQELAREISTAMVTTFVGLAIAIPASIVFSILRNRLARMVLEVGMVSDGLMSRFKKQQ